MASRNVKLHGGKVECPYSTDAAALLRGCDKCINADAQVSENLAESKVEIQKIAQRFGSGLEWSEVRNKLSDEDFVGSMLNDIGKLALRDLNYMMKLAMGSRWIDLKPEEFKIEAYVPDDKLSELITGKYSKNERKCSINLELFTKIFLKPKERQPTSINEKQLTEFLERIYSTAVHEGFHALQDNRLGCKKHIKNPGNANNARIFTEGGARFVEFFAESLINDWKRASLNDSNSLEKAFLWHFGIEPVSGAVYERQDKIRGTLENFIPHNAGMFIFAVRYVANGSFISTLKEICEMAELGNIDDNALYRMLDKDIKNGNLEKLKQKIINL
ncbi:MAG: hypothetical protein M1559_00655 [Candidatus Marsarchaeota archaeon]|nr:hypothetical protein [Candidatus Marsarchaeota archaeon]